MQCAAFLSGMVRSKLIDRALVLAPMTLLDHWAKELRVRRCPLLQNREGKDARELPREILRCIDHASAGQEGEQLVWAGVSCLQSTACQRGEGRDVCSRWMVTMHSFCAAAKTHPVSCLQRCGLHGRIFEYHGSNKTDR